VHNAGVGQRSPAADTELHVTRRILDVNFLGPVALTRAVLPSMRARQNGHLVVVSSVLGTFGAKRRSSYAASKHALHGYFDSLRAELADEGIRVTLICPGYIRTPISEQALTADGTPHGRADPGQAGGMDPARCAARMVRAIEREQREVVIGGWETAGVWLKRWCPSLLARILRRMRMD
jgi:dehydrogenase/reductase SDR family member 7B